jgi:hypothetical protein
MRRLIAGAGWKMNLDAVATAPAVAELHRDIDGLFVGRAAWSPEGFADIAAIVARAAIRRKPR